jgi:hypothetical protein
VSTFRDWWVQSFGSVAPLGWQLRREWPERWLRLHTLPDSKRYADNEAEHAEVRRRQLAVAEEVLGAGKPCWIVVPTYESSEIPSRRFDELSGLDLTRAFSRSADVGEVTFWAAHSTWQLAQFKEALRSISDDGLQALWAADDRSIFAPYDGGIDVITQSVAILARLKVRFSAWRSPRPDGL